MTTVLVILMMLIVGYNTYIIFNLKKRVKELEKKVTFLSPSTIKANDLLKNHKWAEIEIVKDTKNTKDQFIE